MMKTANIVPFLCSLLSVLFCSKCLRRVRKGFGNRWHTTYLGRPRRYESSTPTSSRRRPSSSSACPSTTAWWAKGWEELLTPVWNVWKSRVFCSHRKAWWGSVYCWFASFLEMADGREKVLWSVQHSLTILNEGPIVLKHWTLNELFNQLFSVAHICSRICFFTFWSLGFSVWVLQLTLFSQHNEGK